MMIELIIICVSILALFALYVGRIKSKEGETKLFPDSFLMKIDEVIFDFIKFAFKLYFLLVGNIGSFFKEVPHKFIHTIHVVSHSIAQRSSSWVDTLKGKTTTKQD